MALQALEHRPNYCQFSPDKRCDFLRALTELKNVDLACQRIMVRRKRVDGARSNDAALRAAWSDDHSTGARIQCPWSRHRGKAVSVPLLLTVKRKQLFLERLEETCSPKLAAEAVGFSRKTAYHHKRTELEFSRGWDAAIERALDDLLGEAHRRTVSERSGRLLEVLLKFRYGDRMADRFAVNVEQSIGPDADALLPMNASDRLALQELLERYVSAER